VSPNGIVNVTAYQVSRITVFPTPALRISSSSSDCFSGVSTNASTASQCYAVKASKYGTVTAIKYVGIASSDAFPGNALHTAQDAIATAAEDGYSKVLTEHSTAWNALWDDADIIIPGDTPVLRGLQLAARASLFHLLSNVRQGSEGHGLGDNSIAPAGLTSDSYAGQVFWDADTWMAPSLISLFPSYAEVNAVDFSLCTCCVLIPRATEYHKFPVRSVVPRLGFYRG
jgi:trehalose/maltose hydrolase-like predicted phosphorylase